jgi:uncharacterized membrane protein
MNDPSDDDLFEDYRVRVWKQLKHEVRNSLARPYGLLLVILLPLLTIFLGRLLFGDNIFGVWLTFLVLGMPAVVFYWIKNYKIQPKTGDEAVNLRGFEDAAFYITILYLFLLIAPPVYNKSKFVEGLNCLIERKTFQEKNGQPQDI